MKKLFIILTMFLFMPLAYAQESNPSEILPDSPLYGLDLAIERLELAFASGASAKSEKGLQHAIERLNEIKVMIAQKKLQHAEKAKQQHKKDLDEAKSFADKIVNSNKEIELQQKIHIEKGFDKYKTALKQLDDMNDDSAEDTLVDELTEESETFNDGLISSQEQTKGQLESSLKSSAINKDVEIKTQISALEQKFRSDEGLENNKSKKQQGGN